MMWAAARTLARMARRRKKAPPKHKANCHANALYLERDIDLMDNIFAFARTTALAPPAPEKGREQVGRVHAAAAAAAQPRMRVTNPTTTGGAKEDANARAAAATLALQAPRWEPTRRGSTGGNVTHAPLLQALLAILIVDGALLLV